MSVYYIRIYKIYLLSGSPRPSPNLPKKVLGGCIVHVIIVVMYCAAKSTEENTEAKFVHVSWLVILILMGPFESLI